jgi:hypothetical protein
VPIFRQALSELGTLDVHFVGHSHRLEEVACRDNSFYGSYYLSEIYSFDISKGSQEIVLQIPPQGKAGPNISDNINFLLK